MQVDMPDLELDTAVPEKALAEARERRADLHTVIIALEKATAAPGSDAAEWSMRAHDALVEVGAAFERHIAVVEGPGGLFEEVQQASPRLCNALERLREEHLRIREHIVTALDEVRVVAGRPVATIQEGREAILVVLDQLMRHRQHGADVVYDAYAVDIGTGE
jgi:hypothetical protein